MVTLEIMVISIMFSVVPIGGDLDILATGTRDEPEEDEDMPVFDKHDELLHGIHQGKKLVS